MSPSGGKRMKKHVLCVGHAVQDMVFGVDHMPASADKYRATSFSSVGGGPAATAAVAISKLGGRASLVSRIGDDHIGTIIVAELEQLGVDCSLIQRFSGSQSSLSVVIVDKSGERLIVNYLDADLPSDTACLPENLPASVSVVLADTRWPDGAEKVLLQGKRAGLSAVLDADVPVPADGELLRAATHIAFSAAGLADFTSDPDPRTGLLSVAESFDAWCCVTIGAEGTLYLDGKEIRCIPAFKVPVRDTLGAGDTWHGAFALALAEGRDEIQAARFATAAAALKVQSPGGRTGVPERQEVEVFLRDYVTGDSE